LTNGKYIHAQGILKRQSDMERTKQWWSRTKTNLTFLQYHYPKRMDLERSPGGLQVGTFILTAGENGD